MHKFQIGDIVIGNNNNRYSSTSTGTLCEVISYNNHKIPKERHTDYGHVQDICVSIVGRSEPRTIFPVSSDFFTIHTPIVQENQAYTHLLKSEVK